MIEDLESWRREREALRAAVEAAQALPLAWTSLPVGAIVRRLRREVGLYQWALASRIGARQSRVSKVERGSDLRLSTLRRLFDAMGCDLVILARPRAALSDLAQVNRLAEAERRRNCPL